jgi:hypothetical protein
VIDFFFQEKAKTWSGEEGDVSALQVMAATVKDQLIL